MQKRGREYLLLRSLRMRIHWQLSPGRTGIYQSKDTNKNSGLATEGVKEQGRQLSRNNKGM